MTDDHSLPSALLAAWLFGLGLPMGAMPLVLGAEAFGLPETGLLPVLRRMMRLVPLAALLGVPVLALWLVAGRMDDGGTGRGWWAPLSFTVREAVVLIGLSLLSLRFAAAPRRPRPAAAIAASFAFLLLATLGAADWLLGLRPSPGFSSIGLLLVASQAGSAICAVCLLRPREPATGLLLAQGFATWLGLHFIQFVVAWSANLPDEAAWYLARAGDLGLAAILYGFVVAVLAITFSPFLGGTLWLACLAAAGLSAHLLECWWFVVPAARGALQPGGWDAAAMALAAGLVSFGLWRGRRAAA